GVVTMAGCLDRHRSPPASIAARTVHSKMDSVAAVLLRGATDLGSTRHAGAGGNGAGRPDPPPDPPLPPRRPAVPGRTGRRARRRPDEHLQPSRLPPGLRPRPHGPGRPPRPLRARL